MNKRIKYFIAYFLGSSVLTATAAFVDFIFGIKSIDLGIVQTIYLSISIGLFMGIVFGLTFKVNPMKFPWEYFQ